MKNFKAFSDVVVGSGFDNDGSTWHGYILSTKQWAQFFFNHWFFKLYYFSMTVLNWGTWVKENSTIIFLVFFHQKVKIDYCLTSSTLSRVKRIGRKALHKVLLILDPYQWKCRNCEKSPVHLPLLLLCAATSLPNAWICLFVPG